MDFNITNIRVEEASVSGAIPIIDILDEALRLQLEQLDLKLAFDYMFIMDPPILADIGSGFIGIHGLELMTDFNTTLSEVFSVSLIDLFLDFVQPGNLVSFDGLNDFSTVITNTVNTFGAIIRNRLASIINEQLCTAKVNDLVNHILSLIPDDIELKNTGYYIEGLLYSNPSYVKNSYIQVPLMTTI